MVSDSFETNTIELGRDNFGVRGTQRPQEKGKEIHQNLANCINNKLRDYCPEGRLLREIEKELRCKFLQAEVSVYGYCRKESEIDFYCGKMDAVATRRTGQGHLEVLVAEWKSFSEKDLLKHPNKWWADATYFKKPLYQCLIYRELLQACLKENDITARVGVMLVLIPQKDKPKVTTGLCMDFQRMDNAGLLDRIKEYEWFGVQSKYFQVPSRTLPSKLLNLENLEDGTGVLKRDEKVKDIIKDEATVGDLCKELGLLQLKVRRERQEGSSESEATGNDEG